MMIESSDFRDTKLSLNHGAGDMPALGFGTLIPDSATTISATRYALEAGFRHFDCAERYRNEREVGEALQAGLAAGGIARKDIFVTTKLWNTNHRPERVLPAFDASLERLRLHYLDLYLIHTPFAFQPGDEQDPRDQNGSVIYDRGVTLLDTWRAMESLVDHGRCRAIGLSDITLDDLLPIYESARIKPAVGPGGITPVSAGDGASGVLQGEGHRVFGLRSSGSWNEAGASRRSSHFGNLRTSGKDASAGAAGLGTATWHGFAYHAQDCGAGEREFQPLRPAARRIGRDPSHSDETEVERRGAYRQSGFHSTSQLVITECTITYGVVYSTGCRLSSSGNRITLSCSFGSVRAITATTVSVLLGL